MPKTPTSLDTPPSSTALTKSFQTTDFQVSAKATVSVSIKDWQDGSYTYHINGDEQPVPFTEVEDDLVNLLQNEEDPTFSIYADESVPVKEVVSVMNIAKRNHYKVILATQPE